MNTSSGHDSTLIRRLALSDATAIGEIQIHKTDSGSNKPNAR